MDIQGPTGLAPANAAEAGVCAMDVLGQGSASGRDHVSTGITASVAAGDEKRKTIDEQWQVDPIVYN
jgi:hypothetical protein